MVKESEVLPKSKSKNVFQLDPRNIISKEGFNGREHFDRDELNKLKASIKSNGIISPLEVKHIRGTDQYELIDGERRWIVANELLKEGELSRVPVLMFEGNDIDAIIHMLIRNDGVPLNVVEEAKVIKRLLNQGLTPKEVEVKTGRKKAYQLSLERVLTASKPVIDLISSGRVSHTLILEKIVDPDVDLDVAFKEVVNIAKANEAAGKKKVTKKQLDTALGQLDSYKELKSVLRDIHLGNRSALTDTASETLIAFLMKIWGNKLDRKTIEQLLLKPKK